MPWLQPPHRLAGRSVRVTGYSPPSVHMLRLANQFTGDAVTHRTSSAFCTTTWTCLSIEIVRRIWEEFVRNSDSITCVAPSEVAQISSAKFILLGRAEVWRAVGERLCQT